MKTWCVFAPLGSNGLKLVTATCNSLCRDKRVWRRQFDKNKHAAEGPPPPCDNYIIDFLLKVA